MAVSPGQAIANARRTKTFEEGKCLVFVREMFGVAARDPSAAAAWRLTKFKHPVRSGAQTPRGAPVYWIGGSEGNGHIAIATGNGNCWSSDAGGSGIVAKVNIDELTERWSALRFQGWAEDVNGVRVFDAADAKKRHGTALKKADKVALRKLAPVDVPDVRAVQRALKRRMPAHTGDLVPDGCFGPLTQQAYARWQRRCGFRGDAADGIPGRTSLQRLGFQVQGK